MDCVRHQAVDYPVSHRPFLADGAFAYESKGDAGAPRKHILASGATSLAPRRRVAGLIVKITNL